MDVCHKFHPTGGHWQLHELSSHACMDSLHSMSVFILPFIGSLVSLRLDLRSSRVCVGQVFLASGSEASAGHSLDCNRDLTRLLWHELKVNQTDQTFGKIWHTQSHIAFFFSFPCPSPAHSRRACGGRSAHTPPELSPAGTTAYGFFPEHAIPLSWLTKHLRTDMYHCQLVSFTHQPCKSALHQTCWRTPSQGSPGQGSLSALPATARRQVKSCPAIPRQHPWNSSLRS